MIAKIFPLIAFPVDYTWKFPFLFLLFVLILDGLTWTWYRIKWLVYCWPLFWDLSGCEKEEVLWVCWGDLGDPIFDACLHFPLQHQYLYIWHWKSLLKVCGVVVVCQCKEIQSCKGILKSQILLQISRFSFSKIFFFTVKQ